jgi:hypothetical protein
MSSKRIIKIRSSLYVLLPKGDCDLFGFEGGDPIVVNYLTGVGFLITKQNPGGATSIQVDRVVSMKNYIDGMVAEGRRQIKVDVANARDEFREFMKGGLVKEGYFFMARLPEWFNKARVRPSIDPVLQEEIKKISTDSQTKSNTDSQTKSNTRIQTGSQTVSRKKRA